MSYLYLTCNGTAQVFNKETWSAYQSAQATDSLEGFVAAGVLFRKDVLDTEAEIGEDAYRGCEMTLNTSTGKLMIATNPTVTPGGALGGGNTTAGTIGAVVQTGQSVNKAGNSALPSNSDVVIGAGGRMALYQSSLVSLASAVVGLANGDFDNSAFAIPARLKLDTNADDVSARSVNVTVYFIDETGAAQKEVIQLNNTNSTTPVYSVAKCSQVVAYQVSGTISTVHLRISNKDTSTVAIDVTAPSASVFYGALVPDDSTDPVGQSVQVVATTAPIAGSKLVVKGTDDFGAEQLEVLSFDGVATTAKTTKQFKAINQLLIGADGVATNTYDVKVLANLVGQKVGKSPTGVTVAANSYFVLTRN